ncbi:IspD/TarI family cytidylyltransferase [Saccharomonospora iraqiensis]|uniref:IspD/TarI family cytidylyltransferase n=1 Tax=Saccharomonospora iraqiensis TaxID=52698 RepID=UPI00047E6749|nr:2-C-methyl-D-erythritol 4-phosphate cytidylyltransferase [Saccharomonospora iraqiensis]
MCDTSLLTHCVRALSRSGHVDRIVVAGPPDTAAGYRGAGSAERAASAAAVGADHCPVEFVAGQDDRAGSLRSAWDAVAPGPGDVVLLHDAEYPCTPPETVRAVVEALRAGARAVVPVEDVTDTVKRTDPDDLLLGTRDRDGLRRTLAPWGFTAGVLADADLADPLTTCGAAVHTVPGHPHGMRVRTAFDRAVLEALLEAEGEP